MNELLQIERNGRCAETDSGGREALANTPDVRAANIARGKALIANPDYPSKDQIGQIANLLAANLRGGSSGRNNVSGITMPVTSLALALSCGIR